MSDRSVVELRSFVEQGGSVIADIPPGILNEHGSMRDSWPLAEVFGAHFPTDAPPVIPAYRPEQILSFTKAGKTVSEFISRTGGAVCERGVPWGSVGEERRPAIWENKTGKGAVWLLNFVLEGSEWGARNRLGRSAWWNIVWSGMLDGSGVRPCVLVERVSDGTPVGCGLEVVRYQSGTDEYVAVLRHPVSGVKTENVRVRWPARGYIYDCRSGDEIGFVDSLEAGLRPGHALLYSVLEEKAVNVTIQLASQRISAGDAIAITLRSSLSNNSKRSPVFFVSLQDPFGHVFRGYERVVTAVGTDGTAQVGIPLALNDPSGRWKVYAREIASGRVAEVELEVMPAGMPKENGVRFK